MQAVLDTNFWLATHVVCITLGYATTLLAGMLGAADDRAAATSPAVLDDDQRRQLTRMTYGTLCFAIFFSFIGTVLGGLWADDSWGRFWGWDPKENGALMIVIWNAIVLHARWGKMVGERGLAALAVLRQHRRRLVVVGRQPARRRPALLRLGHRASPMAG